MAYHPRIERNELTTEEAWRLIMDHIHHVDRVSRRMASRADARIEAEDLRSCLLQDLAENIRLWDPDRAFQGWVTSRCWMQRTLMIRSANKGGTTRSTESDDRDLAQMPDRTHEQLESQAELRRVFARIEAHDPALADRVERAYTGGRYTARLRRDVLAVL